MTVQTTGHMRGDIWVPDRSDSSITIKAENDGAVDYRVTGIREGYEDKQVVREQ